MELVMFNASPLRPDPVMGVRMYVNVPILPMPFPWVTIDDQRMGGPQKPGAGPTPRFECGPDGDAGPNRIAPLIAGRRISELLRPGWILGHHVEYGRKREQRLDTRVPLEIVFLNSLGYCVAVHVTVLIGPLSGLRNLIPISRRGQDLAEERIGI
jgi:hypothetical protein